MRPRSMMGNMRVQCYRPRPPLCEFIEFLWFSDEPAPLHARERVLPTGSFQLIINLQESQLRIFKGPDQQAQELSHALLWAAFSEAFIIVPPHRPSLLGVHFRPGGAFPFPGFPADEVFNTHLALEALWGTSARELRERVLEMPTVI